MLVFLCGHWTGLTLTVPLFSPTGWSISIPTRGVPSTACIPAKQRVPFPCGIVKKKPRQSQARFKKEGEKDTLFFLRIFKFIRTSSRGDSKNLKITYFIAINSHPLPCIGHTERRHRCVTMCDPFLKKGWIFWKGSYI